MSGRSSPRAKYYRGSTDGRRPLGHDPLAKVRAAYDVVVIGSGLAGLTATNVLGKLGHRHFDGPFLRRCLAHCSDSLCSRASPSMGSLPSSSICRTFMR